jgi:hypothetical protein
MTRSIDLIHAGGYELVPTEFESSVVWPPALPIQTSNGLVIEYWPLDRINELTAALYAWDDLQSWLLRRRLPLWLDHAEQIRGIRADQIVFDDVQDVPDGFHLQLHERLV